MPIVHNSEWFCCRKNYLLFLTFIYILYSNMLGDVRLLTTSVDISIHQILGYR